MLISVWPQSAADYQGLVVFDFLICRNYLQSVDCEIETVKSEK